MKQKSASCHYKTADKKVGILYKSQSFLISLIMSHSNGKIKFNKDVEFNMNCRLFKWYNYELYVWK